MLQFRYQDSLPIYSELSHCYLDVYYRNLLPENLKGPRVRAEPSFLIAELIDNARVAPRLLYLAIPLEPDSVVAMMHDLHHL